MTIPILLLIVLAVAFLALILFLRLRPVVAVIAIGRFVLRASGLRRKSIGELTYFTGGKGRPLVLVHGVNDQAGSWARPAGALRKRFRLIVPDLPGHGASGPAEGPLSFEMMLDALHRLITKEASGDPVALAGNSLGAFIAVLYTLRYPEDVASLILETGGALEFDTSELNLAPSTREQARRITEQVWGPDMPRVADYVLDDMVRRGPKAPVLRVNASNPQQHFVSEQRLGNIAAPTTLIWGDSDGILPVAYAERTANAIPGARLHVIQRCGHCPHREKTGQFVRIVIDALLSEPSTLNRQPSASYASR
jgi:pimeloyl-ACP methyl ester carboxylesterase